jgi:hypothetical protein
MKRTLLAAMLAAIAASLCTPAFALDQGPRFAPDLLDALVAQHAAAAANIAARHADAPAANAAPLARSGG